MNFFVFSVESDPWMTDDRDYTYEELLQRVFTIMRDKNPEMIAGEKKKFVMRPPQVCFQAKYSCEKLTLTLFLKVFKTN